jgi:hypothetical protein
MQGKEEEKKHTAPMFSDINTEQPINEENSSLFINGIL